MNKDKNPDTLPPPWAPIVFEDCLQQQHQQLSSSPWTPQQDNIGGIGWDESVSTFACDPSWTFSLPAHPSDGGSGGAAWLCHSLTNTDSTDSEDALLPPSSEQPLMLGAEDDGTLTQFALCRDLFLASIPETALPMLNMLVYYNNKIAGLSDEQAKSLATMTTGLGDGADAVGVRGSDIFQPRIPCGGADPEYREGAISTGAALSPGFSRTGKRTWLLEEFPLLLERAQTWVDDGLAYAMECNQRPFKITEFQGNQFSSNGAVTSFVRALILWIEWINNELLRPLFGSSSGGKSVTPISHSTARAWLARLGYYERLGEFSQVLPPNSAGGSQVRSRTKSSVSSSSTGMSRAGRQRSNTWQG